MVFGSRNRKNGAERVTGEAADHASGQREAWRQAAQRVTRIWSEWSAADRRDRPELYRRYVSALDEEELAAARLEPVSDGTEPGVPLDCLAPVAHSGEPDASG